MDATLAGTVVHVLVDSPQGTVPADQLERVWYRKSGRSRRGLVRRGALGLLMLAPLAAAAGALAVALLLDTSAINRLAIVLAAALLGLVAAMLMDVLLEHFDRSYAKGAHRYEIWATWRGAPVLLLKTDDELRFGQAYRAIQRAVERR
jgi:Family of unknown function (DUF6232)